MVLIWDWWWCMLLIFEMRGILRTYGTINSYGFNGMNQSRVTWLTHSLMVMLHDRRTADLPPTPKIVVLLAASTCPQRIWGYFLVFYFAMTITSTSPERTCFRQNRGVILFYFKFRRSSRMCLKCHIWWHLVRVWCVGRIAVDSSRRSSYAVEKKDRILTPVEKELYGE